jgi:periplasmic copper chaperone A
MKRWIALLLLAALLTACSPQPAARIGSIEILSPWARPAQAAGTGNSAAYLTIRNTGKEADRLIKVETTVAEMTETHETKMDGDMMSMSMVDAIEIPAGGSVELKPGGYHIMLMKLKGDLTAGTKISLTLTFEKAGTVKVDADVIDK